MSKNASDSHWTAERVDFLKAEHRVGKSFSCIATAIGGISRSCVAGKAKRLGLTIDPNTFNMRVAAGIHQRPGHTPKQAVVKRVVPPRPRRVELSKAELRAMFAQAVLNTITQKSAPTG